MPKRPPTEKNPNGCTGPTTPEGKESSSKNALKHGCCSKILILPDEDPAEFERIAEGWLQQFDPADFQEETLVEALILNDWSLRRKRRHFFAAEAAAAAASGPDPAAWSAEQRHHLALMQRYKTAAERAFYRSWSALQGLRKDIMNENIKLLKALRKDVSLQEEIDKLEAQLNTPQARASQDSQTPPHQLFQGQLNFPNGVPPEYSWTSSNSSIRESGGAGVQRMDVDVWLQVIEREKLAGTGHIGPTGFGNLPRSENHGGCECEMCGQNRAILEAHANPHS